MSESERLCAQCAAKFSRPPDLSARQWAGRRFCSRACSVEARTARPRHSPCIACGAEMGRRRRPNGRLEDVDDWQERHYCSQSCIDVARASRASGARRLICRTCSDCHALLPAGRFRRRHSGVYERACLTCEGVRDRAARSAERIARERERATERLSSLQEETMRTASRYGQQWTGAELEQVIRDDIPVRVLAARLGRTYAATALARHRASHDPKWMSAVGTSRQQDEPR